MIYSPKELINEKVKGVKSENERIEASEELKNKYSFSSTAMTIHQETIPFAVLLMISTGAIIGVVYLMKRKKKS